MMMHLVIQQFDGYIVRPQFNLLIDIEGVVCMVTLLVAVSNINKFLCVFLYDIPRLLFPFYLLLYS